MKQQVLTLVLLLSASLINQNVYSGNGFSTNSLFATNTFWQLYIAIQNDNCNFIEQQITNKNIANFRPTGESTLLQLAVFFRRPEIIAILLKNGADIDDKNSLGNTALHIAIERTAIAIRMISAVNNLIALNNEIIQHETNNPYAAILQNKNTIQYHTNTTMIQNKDELQRLANVSYAITRQLLDAGASIQIKNKTGKTPFDLAGTTPIQLSDEEILTPENYAN